MERTGYKTFTQTRGQQRYVPFKRSTGPPKQNYSTMNNQEKKYHETFDKTREILRYVWPLNKTGSKQLILGADPSNGCIPTLTIRKPGYSGTKLTGEALTKFLDNIDNITYYFEGGDHNGKTLSLSKDKFIKFGVHYKDRAVFLESKNENEETFSIVLNSFTWNFLKSIKGLIIYCHQQLLSYVPELQRMFAALQNTLAETYDLSAPLDAAEVESYLSEISGDEFELTPDLTLNMDYIRAFYEMKRFSMYDLMNISKK
jgi:hypothetical protein